MDVIGMERGAVPTIEERLLLAERVCLMFGWTRAHDETDREKALHELWLEWLEAFRADGGNTFPPAHPDLSDARVAELAARRDATVERTRAALMRLSVR